MINFSWVNGSPSLAHDPSAVRLMCGSWREDDARMNIFEDVGYDAEATAVCISYDAQ